jgi:hypothetical protein
MLDELYEQGQGLGAHVLVTPAHVKEALGQEPPQSLHRCQHGHAWPHLHSKAWVLKSLEQPICTRAPEHIHTHTKREREREGAGGGRERWGGNPGTVWLNGAVCFQTS